MDLIETPAGRERIYPMSLWIRGFAFLFVLFAALGFIGIYDGGVRFSGPNPGAMVEWSGVALFALLWAVYAFKACVALQHNAIEFRTPIGTKRLRFDQILGRRETVFRNFDGSRILYLTLIPKDRDLPAIKFQRSYAFDSAFWDWYNHLPDLGASGESPQLKTRF
jgi:hypothetical protein